MWYISVTNGFAWRSSETGLEPITLVRLRSIYFSQAAQTISLRSKLTRPGIRLLRPRVSEMDTKPGTTKKRDDSKVLSSYVHANLRNEEQSILEDDFKPLDSFNIRVIDLEPAEARDAPLRCKIESVDVSREWDFAAVSYVWGPPVFSHTLICVDTTVDQKIQDTQIAITPTLDRVLRRFRKAKEKRRLWADAVCS
jgi:hypothetical protein